MVVGVVNGLSSVGSSVLILCVVNSPPVPGCGGHRLLQQLPVPGGSHRVVSAAGAAAW